MYNTPRLMIFLLAMALFQSLSARPVFPTCNVYGIDGSCLAANGFDSDSAWCIPSPDCSPGSICCIPTTPCTIATNGDPSMELQGYCYANGDTRCPNIGAIYNTEECTGPESTTLSILLTRYLLLCDEMIYKPLRTNANAVSTPAMHPVTFPHQLPYIQRLDCPMHLVLTVQKHFLPVDSCPRHSKNSSVNSVLSTAFPAQTIIRGVTTCYSVADTRSQRDMWDYSSPMKTKATTVATE